MLPVCYTIEKELPTMQLITNLLVGLGMVELALVDAVTRIGVERPELIKVINNVHQDLSSDVPYAYHILYTLAHAYHMRQRGVVSDNEWTGWLRWMRNAFRHGTIKEIWKRISKQRSGLI